MKTITKTKLLTTMLSVVLIAFSSCKKDDEEPEVAKGEIAIASALVNPDGMSGSIYLQLIGDLSPKTYDNSTALPIEFGAQVILIGEDLYESPFMGIDAVKKYTRNSNKELSTSGQLTVESNSRPTGIVLKNANKAYLALLGRGKVLIFNPATMTKTGEIDLTSYGVGDENPDPSGMIIRGNKLYVALNQMVGGFFPAPDRKKSDIVIINTDTDKVEKMITEENSDISTPVRPPDCKSIFIDENNDIYIMCLGAWGAVPGHKAGILRIKDGKTEFDNSYNFNLSDAVITGETNKMDYAQFVQYGGDGKLYALVNIPAYYSNPPNYVEDRTGIAVEIDLAAKTMKKLDLPRGNSYSCVGKYNNKIIFGLATDTENGFFPYDMDTKESSSNAIVKTTGFPMMFRHFGEEY